MKDNLKSDEIVLFFDRIDSTLVRQGLGLSEVQKCCDGVVFYACKDRKVICLVEMKSSNLGKAAEQIKTTYRHLHALLERECGSCKEYFKQIIWQAYIYRSGSTPQRDTENCVKALELCFEKGNVQILGKENIADFLRGEEKSGGKRTKQK